MASDVELDRRAVERARCAVAAALGALDFALGAAESPHIRREIAGARNTLSAALHDHIDPAAHAIERRAADEDAAAWGRERHKLAAWHHRRLL